MGSGLSDVPLTRIFRSEDRWRHPLALPPSPHLSATIPEPLHRLQQPRAGGARREWGRGEGSLPTMGHLRELSHLKTRSEGILTPSPPQRIKTKDTFRKEICLVASTPRVPMLLPHFTGDSCWQPKDPQGPSPPRAPGPAGKGGVVPRVSTAHPLRPRTPRGRQRGRQWL